MRPLTSRVHTQPSLTLLQSPKLTTQKWRATKTKPSRSKPKIQTSFSIYETPHMFSMIDVNDKLTNKKGTDLPDQYIRRNTEQLQKILKGEHPKKFLPQKDEKSITSRNITSAQPSSIPMSRQKRLFSSQFKIKRIENAKTNIPSSSKENNFPQVKSDRYIPEDFAYYQEQVKNPSLITKEIAANYSFYRDDLYNIPMKEIKNRCLASDVFMLGPPKGEDLQNTEKFNIRNKQGPISYLTSDIFNAKQPNDFTKMKSSEKYYYINKPDKYTNVRVSKSSWKDKYGFRVVMKNLGSLQYNIISPGINSITPAFKDVDCPVNKTKGLTEFIDLTRVSAPNHNPEYQKFYNDNKRTFHKVHGMCSDYLESYGHSKGIVGKPFSQEKDINI